MKILMVCLGNICRSPLAEGILQSKLPESFTVDSAGTIDMHAGKAPDLRSIQTGKLYNIDISAQQSRPFTTNDFEEYDYIFCMDRSNLADVLSLAKSDSDRKKVSLILGDAEVPDPYWGGLEDFDKVYHMLDKAANTIASKLTAEVEKQL
ncbi:MAG: low molecular weight protein-tyrosine-phosphatase [Kaistella sp.]